MSPLFATFLLWDLWVLSWGLAALWSRQAQARAPARTELLNRIPTGIGGLLLFFGSGLWVGPYRHFGGAVRLWVLPSWAGWTAVGLCAAGFAFAWWARLTLGELWAGTVSRKENHEIIQHGPYALVRHPIYSGMLVAAFALAIQIGMLANLVGAALLSVGFWMRARSEERFLSSELGEAVYANYRRRTPMLTPFWPSGR
jgi:protein-S-isoprenylcysteine O-methyltransferase Ste14